MAVPSEPFAAVYEGDVGSKVHGGSAAAPMIADVFKDIYQGEKVVRQQQQRPGALHDGVEGEPAGPAGLRDLPAPGAGPPPGAASRPGRR